MYVIKRTDTNEYFQAWGWMGNKWDAQFYDEWETEGAVEFFADLGLAVVAVDVEGE